MKKEDIRRFIKAQKALLTDEERMRAADAVFAALESSPAFIMADNILLYHSLPDELSTRAFIDKWHTR
jgi:5-formyltetrahydrofolate cyclo-ligase